MLFTGVAAYDRSAVVSARFVGAEHLFGQGLLQINHKAFVKFQITHIEIRWVYHCSERALFMLEF